MSDETMKLKRIFLLGSIVCLSSMGFGFVKPLDVNPSDLPKVERWATAEKSLRAKKIKTARDPLVQLGLSRSLEDWSGCVKYAKSIPAKSQIKDWVVLYQLECAIQSKAPALLKEALANAEKSIGEWKDFLTAKRLSQNIVDGNVFLAQWYENKSQWKELKTQLTKIFKIEESLSKQQRSLIYFYAGNLQVAERQWSSAYLQFKRSKELSSTSEVDSRLKAILPMLPVTVRQEVENQTAKEKAEFDAQTLPLQLSSDEAELFNLGQSYIARNDQTGAVASLAKLIRTFPMGIKAKWAQDKILEILSQEIDKSKGPNGESVAKKHVESVMLDFDSDRQFEWGKSLFDQQYYSVAAPILKKSAEQAGGATRAAKAFYLSARAFQLSQNYSQAKTIYKLLVKNFPAAPEVSDAAIQWALINYNEKDASEAISHLEMARARKLTSQQDLITSFWLFQSYKMKGAETEALKAAAELVKKFPITYYGLLAYQEINKRLPSYEKELVRSAKVNFSDRETLALVRARILLQAGFLDPANDELSVFNSRVLSSDEGQYLSGFYAQSLHYSKAFGLLNSGIEDLPERHNLTVIRQIFPKEFWDQVTDDKKRSDLDPLLLLSVMKQESAFDYEAVSHSGAMGLLQMIPPTAEDVKRELKSTIDVSKDLFDPGNNIRFCAYYLSTLIKKYNGSIPLALAAYNAGPRRISTFISAKGGLSDTWVDELPWSEPSFYVKSILKNYIFYRIVYNGMDQLPTPPWAVSPSSSTH